MRFAEQEGAACITTELARRWATQPVDVHPAHGATRRSPVRRFAQSCGATAPHTEIPPQGLLPYRDDRTSPSMSTEQEISQLLAAAHQLRSLTGLRARTSATVLGWLAVTGMRLSEAIGLEREDVDLTDGSLPMRPTTCGKTRGIPRHPATQHVLGPSAG
ncbi:MAG: tyrosine-type recombinase/integrase, partial [Candidatus Entotheonellia bacterium]